MGLLFRESACGIPTMAISATKYDMRRLVHGLDALVALVAANALGVG